MFFTSTPNPLPLHRHKPSGARGGGFRKPPFSVAADPALPDSQRIGLSIATASRLVILGLTPGQQIWARVRAKRGKRFGPWSEAGTRIVNV